MKKKTLKKDELFDFSNKKNKIDDLLLGLLMSEWGYEIDTIKNSNQKMPLNHPN